MYILDAETTREEGPLREDSMNRVFTALSVMSVVCVCVCGVCVCVGVCVSVCVGFFLIHLFTACSITTSNTTCLVMSF